MIEELLKKIKKKYYDLELNRKNLIKIGSIVLIALIILGARVIGTRDDNIIVDTSSTPEQLIETNMYVDISGEVKNPGVYQFEAGTRLYQVIDKAGGLTSSADKNGINQAEFIEDGQKIIIPSLKNYENNNSNSDNNNSNYSKNGLININFASKDELMNITGVGEVIADRIIEYRSNCSFNNIEDIMNVKGIGNAKFEKMKAEITV